MRGSKYVGISGARASGDSLNLRVLRDGVEMDMELILGARPDS